MFDYVQGILVQKRPTTAVIDVNGVGYAFKISLSTSQKLPQEGQKVTLKSYLHVREDIFQLYGFISEEERELFTGLLSISGVGPKLAQTLLSGLSPDRLAEAIQNGDERTLSSISGVGSKTAQRLIVELKDKVKKFVITAGAEQKPTPAVMNTMENEAVMALISLGYSKQQAEKTIIRVRQTDKALTAEELIKKALQTI